MTLEQRVEALEAAIANMTAQQNAAKEMSEIASKVIKDACRPGGILHAAQQRTAERMVIKGDTVKVVDKNGATRLLLRPLL